MSSLLLSVAHEEERVLVPGDGPLPEGSPTLDPDAGCVHLHDVISKNHVFVRQQAREKNSAREWAPGHWQSMSLVPVHPAGSQASWEKPQHFTSPSPWVTALRPRSPPTLPLPC